MINVSERSTSFYRFDEEHILKVNRYSLFRYLYIYGVSLHDHFDGLSLHGESIKVYNFV